MFKEMVSTMALLRMINDEMEMSLYLYVSELISAPQPDDECYVLAAFSSLVWPCLTLTVLPAVRMQSILSDSAVRGHYRDATTA
jgi:hypothetical protein